MKKVLFLFFLLPFIVKAQYNPSRDGITVNSPLAPAQSIPTDARSWFHDISLHLYRPFQSIAEGLGWDTGIFRSGNFSVWISTGTLQSNGSFVGGTVNEWMWRRGILDSQLVQLNIDPIITSGFLQAANNLSDVVSASSSRSNLGLGTMATQGITASSTDLSGPWPSGLIVNSIQGHNLAYIQNYNNLTNQPTIPALLNPISGPGISITGIYPNLTWSATGTTTFLRGVGGNQNYLSPQYTTPSTNPETGGFDSLGLGTTNPNSLLDVKGHGIIDTFGITYKAEYLGNWHNTTNIRDSGTVMPKGYEDSLYALGFGNYIQNQTSVAQPAGFAVSNPSVVGAAYALDPLPGEAPHFFEVVTDSSHSTFETTHFSGFSGGGGANWHSRLARGTVFNPQPVQAQDFLFSFGARGWTQADQGFSESAGSLQFIADENFDSTHNGTYAKIGITQDGHYGGNRVYSMIWNANGSVSEPGELFIGPIIGGAGEGLRLTGEGAGGSTNREFLSFYNFFGNRTGYIGSFTNNNMVFNVDSTAGEFIFQGANVIVNNSVTANTLSTNIGTSSGGMTHWFLENGSSQRWGIGLYGPESGSNSGSNFYLACSTDGGSGLSIPFEIKRDSGYTMINKGLFVFSNPLLRYQLNATGISLLDTIKIRHPLQGVPGTDSIAVVGNGDSIIKKISPSYYAISGSVSGTTNQVAKFTSSSAIGNSIIYDNGTGVAIGGTSPRVVSGYTVLDVGNATNGGLVNFSNGTGTNYGYINGIASTISIQSGAAIGLVAQGVSNSIIFSTNGSQRGFFSPSGPLALQNGMDLWGLSNGANTDSVLTIIAGAVRKVASTTFLTAVPTWQQVMAVGSTSTIEPIVNLASGGAGFSITAPTNAIEYLALNNNTTGIQLGIIAAGSQSSSSLPWANNYGYFTSTQGMTISATGSIRFGTGTYGGSGTEWGRFDSAAGAFMVEGTFANGTWNNITTGTSSTIPAGFSNTLFNPSSLIATYTLTLPASPLDGQIENIYFGGTIAGGTAVVTALTISANSGQTLEQQTAPTTGVGGTVYKYKYNSSLSKWFRDQ